MSHSELLGVRVSWEGVGDTIQAITTYQLALTPRRGDLSSDHPRQRLWVELGRGGEMGQEGNSPDALPGRPHHLPVSLVERVSGRVDCVFSDAGAFSRLVSL